MNFKELSQRVKNYQLRGVCVEEDGYLTEIVETKGIDKNTELDMESQFFINLC